MRWLVVSDIHGQFVALQKAAHRAAFSPSRDRLIVLGDLVDRGPDSRMVVRWVRDAADVVVRGNHEDLWLQWLDTRDPLLLDDLRTNGGSATLAAYHNVSDWLADIAWFRSLPLFFQDQGRVFVHAGLRPYLPLDSQRANDLLWIREDFTEHPWTAPEHAGIVFGHTPTHYLPGGTPGRVWRWHNRAGIDTGAGFGGPVTFWNPDTGEAWPSTGDPYHLSALPAGVQDPEH